MTNNFFIFSRNELCTSVSLLGCYLESVNQLCICMSGWLVCDLLMFGTASYAAFDVCGINECA